MNRFPSARMLRLYAWPHRIPRPFRSALHQPSFVMRWADRVLLRLMVYATPLAKGNDAAEVQTKTYVMF
jgi:hypothetical protein